MSNLPLSRLHTYKHTYVSGGDSPHTSKNARMYTRTHAFTKALRAQCALNTHVHTRTHAPLTYLSCEYPTTLVNSKAGSQIISQHPHCARERGSERQREAERGKVFWTERIEGEERVTQRYRHRYRKGKGRKGRRGGRGEQGGEREN